MNTELDFTPWPAEYRDTYREAGYWASKPLTAIVSDAARANPDKAALIDGNRTLSFAELDAASDRLARHFLGCGLKPADKAVVQLPNGAELYIVYWALLKASIRPVFALFNHNALELEAFCRQLQPKLLIVSQRHKLFATEESRQAVLQACGSPEFLLHEDEVFELATRSDATTPLPASRADDVAFFQLSGGSTSTPKLIPRTHDDYYYSIRRSAEICKLDTSSVYLCALPAPHNFPMSSPGALGIWHAGGTVVTAPDPSPGTCFPLIERHRVSFTSLVPPIVTLWLNAARSQRAQLASLEVLQVGGAKLPETLACRIEPELGCRLQQVFGMAEGLVCYTRLDDDDWHRFNTQGRPMSDADEIKIVDEHGSQVPDGEPGLLMTRGPYTIRGYYRAAEHNRQAFDCDGFYTTGDVVIRTPSGHLIVAGRAKDQINRGGEKIAAEEVENLLLKYPGILQAAVVAMPDANLGEKSCAFLVCKGELPKPHLVRKHLRTCGIADYKLPDHFIKLDSLPLTPVGKPDKSLLRKEVVLGDS